MPEQRRKLFGPLVVKKRLHFINACQRVLQLFVVLNIHRNQHDFALLQLQLVQPHNRIVSAKRFHEEQLRLLDAVYKSPIPL